MLKIYIPNNSDQKIGGGWSAIKNIKTGLEKLNYVFVNNWMDADIILIVGVSMTVPRIIDLAREAGKKIIFRVDNIPRKSRNKRSRIYSRMKDFGQKADFIVYQSQWAKEYAEYLIGYPEKSRVIYNGVNKDIFYPPEKKTGENKNYLFVQYNRDDNKRLPEALYYFHKLWRADKYLSITLLGQFSPELIEAGFDFFDDENFIYIPPVEKQFEMAEIYRKHDILLFPAFADASPNTVSEALACGLNVELVNPVGGTIEIIDRFKNGILPSIDDMAKEYNKLLI